MPMDEYDKIQKYSDMVHTAASHLSSIKTKDASYELILQRHRTLSLYLLVSTIVNRVLCFVCIFLTIVGSFLFSELRRWPFLVAIEMGLIVICAVWFYTDRIKTLDLRALETLMMRETGGNWEDRYIKARYGTAPGEGWISRWLPEPVCWVLGGLTVMLFVSTMATAFGP